MKDLTVILLIASSWVIGNSAVGAESNFDYSDQIVSLSITCQTYDQIKPWSKRLPYTRPANAVVVEGPLLLTSAQMVADATFLQAKNHNRPGKVPARIVHVDRDINLALIAVDKEGFFDDLKPAPRAERLIKEGVLKSIRWKNSQLEVSSSRIRRIEVHASITGGVEQAHLILMTDFTDGGWAEPVFSDRGLLGLTVSQSQRNVTRVLPVETINAYLAGVSEGDAYKGFGVFGAHWQVNRDHAVAKWLGMTGEPYGVLILRIPRGVTGDGILHPKDILISLGGHDIDADGFYVHPFYGRLRFTNILMEGHRKGDKIAATVFRENETIGLELTLKGSPADLPLVPSARSNHAPAYMVAGGLVFRELDYDFLRAFGKDWKSKASPRMVTLWALEGWEQTREKRRVIILAYVMPDSYNIGYHSLNNLIVSKVNGRPINFITDMREAFRHPEKSLHTITFVPNPQRNEIVLDADGLEKATDRIVRMYGIPQGMRTEEKTPPDF